MRVLVIEPFGAGSHRSFWEGFALASGHDVELLVMPARAWKWRMRTASLAVLGRVVAGDREGRPFEALFVSDYLGLAELLALLPAELRGIWTVVYFHENQLTYPLREGERRDVHHGLTNIHSALAADRVVFNSEFHRRAFLAAAREVLEKAPEVDAGRFADALEAKSAVTPLGTDLERGVPRPLAADEPPILVWNHRWEYDKAPELFAAGLDELARRGFDFRLLLLGQRFRKRPAALAAIESRHAARILESGHAETRADYIAALDRGHLAVSTSRHEFFGLATLEALRRGLCPVLPNDLAYPELLPPEWRREPLLFDPDRSPTTIADAIKASTELLRHGPDPRAALIAATGRFHWRAVAPDLDGHLAGIRCQAHSSR